MFYVSAGSQFSDLSYFTIERRWYFHDHLLYDNNFSFHLDCETRENRIRLDSNHKCKNG